MFYVIRVEYNIEKEAENRQIFGYETYDEAEIQFHKIMAADIANPTLNRAMSIIFDDATNVLMREVWRAPEPQPEPEEEEVEDDNTEA